MEHRCGLASTGDFTENVQTRFHVPLTRVNLIYSIAAAGTGKTHVLDIALRLNKAFNHGHGAFTAPTGVASAHIPGGNSIYQMFHLPCQAGCLNPKSNLLNDKLREGLLSKHLSFWSRFEACKQDQIDPV